MKKITNFIKTIITYTLWSFIALVCALMCVPLACLPAKIRYDNRLYFFCTTLVSRMVLAASFIRIKIVGRDNLSIYPEKYPEKYPKNPSIIISNHASALDIPLLEIIAQTYPHVWMSKAEYLKVPVFGFLLKRMHVTVDRTHETSAGRAFVKAYQLVKDHKRHLLLFPEGTRHTDGKIHEFNNGFALLAKKLDRPVIPIVITSGAQVFSAKSFLIDSSAGHITMSIGKPMICMPDESVEDFARRVHDFFKEELKRLQKN